jgi:L-lactate dehydrogenase
VKIAVGVGAVGSATTLSLLGRGLVREIVLVDQNAARARAVALDMRYGAPLVPPVDVRAGGNNDLTGAALLIVTAGVNEAARGATDRDDPAGRLRLLDRKRQDLPRADPTAGRGRTGGHHHGGHRPAGPLADLTRALVR